MFYVEVFWDPEKSSPNPMLSETLKVVMLPEFERQRRHLRMTTLAALPVSLTCHWGFIEHLL